MELFEVNFIINLYEGRVLVQEDMNGVYYDKDFNKIDMCKIIEEIFLIEDIVKDLINGK